MESIDNENEFFLNTNSEKQNFLHDQLFDLMTKMEKVKVDFANAYFDSNSIKIACEKIGKTRFSGIEYHKDPNVRQMLDLLMSIQTIEIENSRISMFNDVVNYINFDLSSLGSINSKGKIVITALSNYEPGDDIKELFPNAPNFVRKFIDITKINPDGSIVISFIQKKDLIKELANAPFKNAEIEQIHAKIAAIESPQSDNEKVIKYAIKGVKEALN